MEKNQINDYIAKLKEMEKELSSDEPGDLSIFGELDGLLSSLNRDVQNAVMADANQLKVNIKKLHQNAVIPSYSKDGDAGMDLVSTEIISETTEQVTYGTGIALEIPKGYVGLVFPRSSVRKYDLSLTNCVGVIDSGYRGEIQTTFKKTNWLKGDSSDKYVVGDRIAQIMIIPYPKVVFNEVNDLSSTDRGEGGFGSTGA
jgi:dUTP pyrophosphatase